MALALPTFQLNGEFLWRTRKYPAIRFMGSKSRLLPWIGGILSEINFGTALDAFSGSGCVAYLLKSMGKQVTTNDFLNFSALIAKATVENSHCRLTTDDVECLLAYDCKQKHFIERTFSGIFYTPADLRFLDRVSWNIRKLRNSYKQAMAVSALVRSCAKRQPRGVFTVAGDPEHYKDARRDLTLSLCEHFLEQVSVYNATVFDNGHAHVAIRGDAFSLAGREFDLVYLDPPYVPRSDDNCYMKRYHFLEGLSCYWKNCSILYHTKVKKIKKPYTPFSYRSEAINAFDRLFSLFSRSIIVLSYSSNGYPDLEILIDLVKRHKQHVELFEKNHRYHFGTHAAANRTQVSEYLVVAS